jgi:hypothetical protein
MIAPDAILNGGQFFLGGIEHRRTPAPAER